jgi:hypothetical protein
MDEYRIEAITLLPGVCTICIGKNEIGWQHHFGVLRQLDNADHLYRGD